MEFSDVTFKDSFIWNGCLVVAVSKVEKYSLEHLSEQYVNDIRCWYMYDFLSLPTCIRIYSCCQKSGSLIDKTSIATSTAKLIDNLRYMFTLIWLFCVKSTSLFSLVKTNLTFIFLQSIWQNLSTFFRVSLEWCPINRILKYLILISCSMFWEFFSFV